MNLAVPRPTAPYPDLPGLAWPWPALESVCERRLAIASSSGEGGRIVTLSCRRRALERFWERVGVCTEA